MNNDQANTINELDTHAASTTEQRPWTDPSVKVTGLQDALGGGGFTVDGFLSYSS